MGFDFIFKLNIKIVNFSKLPIGDVRRTWNILIEREVFLYSRWGEIEIVERVVEALEYVLNQKRNEECVVYVDAVIEQIQKTLSSENAEKI